MKLEPPFPIQTNIEETAIQLEFFKSFFSFQEQRNKALEALFESI